MVHDATWALPGGVSNLGSSKLCVIKVFSRRDCHLGRIHGFFFVPRHATSDSDKTQRGEVEERVSRSLFHLHCEVIPQVNLA